MDVVWRCMSRFLLWNKYLLKICEHIWRRRFMKLYMTVCTKSLSLISQNLWLRLDIIELSYFDNNYKKIITLWFILFAKYNPTISSTPLLLPSEFLNNHIPLPLYYFINLQSSVTYVWQDLHINNLFLFSSIVVASIYRK